MKVDKYVQEQLEPQESIGHGFTETGDCDITHDLNEEPV